MADGSDYIAGILSDLQRDGRAAALDRLTPVLYNELRRIAHAYLQRERPGHTLQATALVNEAYMLLVGQRHVEWKNKAHFLGVAAQAMRYVLLDYARARRAQKRGAGHRPATIDEHLAVSNENLTDLLVIDDALKRLEQLDSQQAKIVELRFYGGLSVEETAEALGISTATVKREWRMARAWLGHELAWNDAAAHDDPA
jgi:RNA polymerase sigma factor (TIGR02999 family)